MAQVSRQSYDCPEEATYYRSDEQDFMDGFRASEGLNQRHQRHVAVPPTHIALPDSPW